MNHSLGVDTKITNLLRALSTLAAWSALVTTEGQFFTYGTLMQAEAMNKAIKSRSKRPCNWDEKRPDHPQLSIKGLAIGF